MDKKEAIGYLKERLGEIPALARLRYNNDEYPLWIGTIRGVIEKVFGRESIEYQKLATLYKLTGSFNEVRQNSYKRNLKKRETEILSIIKTYETLGFGEEVAYQANNTIQVESPIDLFDKMQFHPRVIEASKSCFVSGHYREAILNSFISLIDHVKEKTVSEDDGKSLMAHAFDEKSPLIKLNNLKNKTERDEQEGFKFLFMGATVGIRNPKAHTLIPQSDPRETLEYLALASLLMRRVEEGKVSKKSTRKPKLDEATFIARCTEGNHQNSILLHSKIKDLLSLRRNNGDFINWGVSGYSYNIAWKGYPAGETIFTGSTDGNLSLWLYIIEKSGDTGQKYLQNLRKIADFGSKVDDYRKHKEPGFSTNKMTSADIDAFISAIEELAMSLEAESSKLDSGSKEQKA